MDEPIIPFQLGRMFLGDHPALFYAEIVVRTLLIYGYTLALIRWIGGRSVAQLSLVDLLLVIALGSAVGDSTFYDDVPMLQAMLVITIIVALNKLLDTLIERSDTVKHLIDGRTVVVARDGRILPEGLAHRDLSALEVKAMLRLAGVRNLGEVELACLEAGGGLSVFRRDEPLPGLDIMLPPGLLPESQRPVPDPAAARNCCGNCGAVHGTADRSGACPDCGRAEWTAAAPPRVRRQDPEAA